MSDQMNPGAMPEKLPVGQGFSYSYGFFFKNLLPLFRLGLIPVILFGLLNYFVFLEPMVDMAIATKNRDMTAVADHWWVNLFGYIALLPLVPFATAWHRYSLTGDKAQTGFLSLRVGREEFVFLGYYILVSLISALPLLAGALMLGGPEGGVPPQAAGNYFIVMVLLWGLMVFLWIRLSLVFPAAAIGAPAGLKDSWRATKGSFWRCFAIWVLVFIPLVLFVIVAGTVVMAPTMDSLQNNGDLDGFMRRLMELSVLLNLFFYWIGGGLLIGALSYIYKYLTQKDQGGVIDTAAFD